MVERLKDAIAKARLRRGDGQEAPASQGAPGPQPRDPGGEEAARVQRWSQIPLVSLDEEQLRRERIISYRKSDASYVTFDVLRTRLLKVMRDTGWKRIAVTSPTKGCGKTVVSTNLAFSFARHEELRVMLFDLDLKAPRMASVLGQREKRNAAWLLTGERGPEDHLIRVEEKLAVSLNTERVRDSAELIESSQTARTLEDIQERFRPDITIYDLPPMLVNDDALAFMPNVDCALLVAAAGQTRATQIDECEGLLTEYGNFLGVLLNKHVSQPTDSYYYGYY